MHDHVLLDLARDFCIEMADESDFHIYKTSKIGRMYNYVEGKKTVYIQYKNIQALQGMSRYFFVICFDKLLSDLHAYYGHKRGVRLLQQKNSRSAHLTVWLTLKTLV